MKRWVYAALALGAAIRLSQFVQRRSLYIDEAMLALSIASRSFRELIRPLDYDQMAPIPFVWAVHLATTLGGVSELTLRLVPLVSGVLLLWVLAELARRLVDRGAAVWVVATAALCPVLIYYSNDVKPYMLDALVTAVLLRLALDVVDARAGAWRRLLWGGALGGWVSAPAALTMAGIVVALAAPAGRHRRPSRADLGALCVVWGGCTLLAYALVYRRAATGVYMRQFWGDGFLRVDSLDGLVYSWVITIRAVWELLLGVPPDPAVPMRSVLLLTALGVAVAAALAGGAILLSRRHGDRVALLLMAPLAVTAAASLCQVYPVATRLLLFQVPLVLLLAGACLERLVRGWPTAGRLALLGLLLAGYAAQTWPASGRWTLGAFQQSQAREAVARLRAENDRLEPVYVFSRGIPIWTFYTTDWKHPDRTRLAVIHQLAGPGGPAFENAPSRGMRTAADASGLELRNGWLELLGASTGMQWSYPRGFRQPAPDSGWSETEASRIRASASPGIWLCFFHYVDQSQEPLLRRLERIGGRRVGSETFRGALLYRYEFP